MTSLLERADSCLYAAKHGAATAWSARPPPRDRKPRLSPERFRSAFLFGLFAGRSLFFRRRAVRHLQRRAREIREILGVVEQAVGQRQKDMTTRLPLADRAEGEEPSACSAGIVELSAFRKISPRSCSCGHRAFGVETAPPNMRRTETGPKAEKSSPNFRGGGERHRLARAPLLHAHP